MTRAPPVRLPIGRCPWRLEIRLTANSESIRERAGRPRNLSGLESVRDALELAEFRNEVARRRAVMKRRVEAIRDQPWPRSE